ncbi:hypothetical protein [Ammoniphilus sp. YIM 78166]|uniref:hypothetical protein n=1 Tax=Ammoniphilus sp. YIM 78166 TaxID=1644106 RepID=UPI0014317946|nr:hypothetical protein [Ammoniphilus sp. YIM 78166]
MIDYSLQPNQRFVVVPSAEQHFIAYDCLLEQPIGSPFSSMQPCMEMVTHLNRIAPDFE